MSKRLEAHRGRASASDAPHDPDHIDDEDEELELPDGKKKEPKMTDTITQADLDAAIATASAKATADTAARFHAVLGSEHYKGREGFAAKLLKNDKLSAEEINGMLADAPAAAAAAPAGDDAKERERVLGALDKGQPEDLGTGGELKPEANHGWADIHAEVRASRGLK